MNSLLVATTLFIAATVPAAENQFRAARSVHLGYSGPPSSLFYNEVVVEKSVNGSYFMACGWDTGYFGIQQLGSPEREIVLFSVWDPTHENDPGAVKAEDRVEMLYQGDGVRIKRFGGEGTGGQCRWPFKWRLGETNCFLVGAEIQGNKTAYTAWFKADSAWKKLATFRTRTGGRPLSGYYSFIEDFRRDGQSVDELRRARFGNGWVKSTAGEWVGLAKARFTASNSEWESKANIDAGIEGGWFFLATGGSLKMSRELRSFIELPLGPARPPSVPLDSAAQSAR